MCDKTRMNNKSNSYQNGGGGQRGNFSFDEAPVNDNRPDDLYRRQRKRNWLFLILSTCIMAALFACIALAFQNHPTTTAAEQTHQDNNNNTSPATATNKKKKGTKAASAVTDNSVPPPPASAAATSSGAVSVHDDKVSAGDKLKSSSSSSGGGKTPSGCETTLMIMRHCEKLGPETTTSDGNQHCSYVGHERAHYLPTLFGSEPLKWPVPSVLYALGLDRGSHLNFREIETLQPLAKKYGLKIESKFKSNGDLIEKFEKQLRSGDLCGKLVLASWKHEYIVDLATKLNCPNCPQVYDADEFDEVWQLKYVYNAIPINQSIEDDDDVDDATSNNKNNDPPFLPQSPQGRTLLRKHKKQRPAANSLTLPSKKWSIYFSKSNQGFDPLKFSHMSGDYDGSSKVGGKWLSDFDDGEM